MFYNTQVDYLIDNRNGIAKELKTMLEGLQEEKATEIRDRCLDAYDFVARMAISSNGAYKAIKDAYIGSHIFGKRRWARIERKSCERKYLKVYVNGMNEYYRAIAEGRKVGYSALEEDEATNEED